MPDHLARRLPRAPERAVHVHVENTGESVERHLVDAHVRVRSGIVDEHVEPAEALDRDRHEVVDLLRHGHVACSPCDPVVVVGQPTRGGLHRIGTTIREQHGRARLGEATRSREAESLRSARDESSPSAEVEQFGDRRRGVGIRRVSRAHGPHL